jgi:hypothetical protein
VCCSSRNVGQVQSVSSHENSHNLNAISFISNILFENVFYNEMQPKYDDQPYFLFVKFEEMLNLISIRNPYCFDIDGIVRILP